jgi:O-Antigen ligase
MVLVGRAEQSNAPLVVPMLLGLSLILGGGGSPAPLLELVLQLLVAALFGLWLWRHPQAVGAIARPVWWIAALVVALPLLQLIPLPSALWQGLPGRGDQIAALELVGAEDSWRALSLSSPLTLASLLAATSALPCLIVTASLGPAARWRLLMVVGTAGILSLVVGAAQISGGAGSPFRFFDPEEIFLTGFQANHNSTADVLLITMLALAALGRHAIDKGRLALNGWQLVIAALAVDGVLVLGLFLAGSRAGLILLPLVLLLQFMILQPDRKLRLARMAAAATGAAALGLIAIWLLRGNRAIEAVLARFTLNAEFRPELWRDSLFALDKYWPVGSGQGTYGPVIMAVERLEVVDPSQPHRAHNDYLELAIEGGLPAIIILIAIAFLILTAAVRSLRQSGASERAQVLFAIGTLMVIALHSLVDYPVRSMALAAMAATAVGLLFSGRQSGLEQPGESQS